MLQTEIGKALLGDSPYSAEDLTDAIRILKTKLTTAEEKLQRLKTEIMRKAQEKERLAIEYRRFKGWADRFDQASLEEKKMIACQMFERIEIGKGYQVWMEPDAAYRQFCGEWNGKMLESSAKADR